MTVLLDLAGLALQAATLVGVLALLVTAWGERRRPRPLEHVDHDPSLGAVEVGRRGRITVAGLVDRRLVGPLRVGSPPGLVVYEVWALTRAGWVQLVPDGEGTFGSALLGAEPVRRLRLWVDTSSPPDTRPARQASPMLTQAAVVLAQRQPSAAPSLPPIAASSLAALRWATEREGDVLVTGLLEGWTEACLSASRVGWVLGIPTGDSVLSAWARAVTSLGGDPAVAFARWFVGEIGKATRRGLADRETVDRREPVARLLLAAAGRLVRGLDPALELEISPPRAVGPRQRESWLVDEALAVRLDNAPVNGLVQPVVVLRPALRSGGTVLLEGEVA